MTKRCLKCNKEFEAKRSDARFCSDKCTKAFSRIKSDNVGDIKSDKIISDKLETNEQRIGKVIEGYCHGCGRKIIDIKSQWVNGVGNEKAAKLICICLDCVRKGITHKGLGLNIKKCDK